MNIHEHQAKDLLKDLGHLFRKDLLLQVLKMLKT